MRINRWIAIQTGVSRRRADELIAVGAVTINGVTARPGDHVEEGCTVTVKGVAVATTRAPERTILLHKPPGYVCSRDGQGAKTVYDLLPAELQHLKIAGRLDKDSSGLVILSTDGQVIQELSHPSNKKKKTYIITTRKPIREEDLTAIAGGGVDIGDRRPSRFAITKLPERNTYKAVLSEGRNRQIRRTMEAIHNQVVTLHRVRLGPYELGELPTGGFSTL